MTVHALIVAHEPAPDFRDFVIDLADQGMAVTVVYNGGVPTAGPELETRIRVLRSPRNQGLAAGLNLGLRGLEIQSDDVLLFLDEDSRPAPDYVARLIEVRNGLPACSMVASNLVRTDGGYHSTVFGWVDKAFLSGLSISGEGLRLVGGFREAFFVDYVDYDFCFRARQKGIEIWRDESLRIRHRLGTPRVLRLGGRSVEVPTHPLWRCYYIARNCNIVRREYGATVGTRFREAFSFWSWCALRAYASDSSLRMLAVSLVGWFDGYTHRDRLVGDHRHRSLTRLWTGGRPHA